MTKLGAVPTLVHLEYRGVTPIATCHWQWVGNVLANRGVKNAWEMLGLSWGCRWTGGPVLFGIATWPALLRKISGAEVAILTFDGSEQARAAELRLSHAGVPYIAEIDEYYIPASSRDRAHVVHAVLVVERDEERALIVDSTIGPSVMECSAIEYELMRASVCVGRVENHKLYAIPQTPVSNPNPDAMLDAIRRHLNLTFPKSLEALERYIDWAETNVEPIDVCRAAGERFQAARLFEYLARTDVGVAIRAAALLNQLSDDWYLIHMLASHERSPQHRIRIVRLLKQLAKNEIEMAETVLG